MISKRMDCRGRECTTELHEGVCQRTSTPHQSGNKKKKKTIHVSYLSFQHEMFSLPVLEHAEGLQRADDIIRIHGRLLTQV